MSWLSQLFKKTPPSGNHSASDFSKLDQTRHMLQWFADEPYAAIRSHVENMLKQQVPDSRLLTFRVTSAPQWLTCARPSDGDQSKAILVRSGVAFEFELTAETQGQSHPLTGVFTWAGIDLDKPGQHKHRVWLDLKGTLAEFGSEGELAARIYFEQAPPPSV